MKFGVRLPNSGSFANSENIQALASSAEDMGYHSVWVHDHIIWNKEQAKTHPTVGAPVKNQSHNNFFESITTLAYVAGMCKNTYVGLAAVILPLRNPIILAKQLANIQILSNSRLLVGVVPGAPRITEKEFEALRVDYHQRGKIMDEYLRVMKVIWSRNPASFNGVYVSFNDIEVMPKPDKIPLLIGGGEKGLSERALRRVIEHGDGWIPAYLTPEELTLGIQKIREGLKKSDRLINPLIVHEMFVCIDNSYERAINLVKNNFGSIFGNVEEGERRSLVGEPDRMIARLEQYEEAGVDITELKFLSPDFNTMRDMVIRFAKDVAPSF